MFFMMYHLIGDPTAEMPSIKAVSTWAFAGQLDYLLKHHEPVGHDEILACIREGRELPENGFALTFDHATKDHIEIALPELRARGLQGLFYVITGVLEDGYLPEIEKQRFMEAHFADYREFLEAFHAACVAAVPDKAAQAEPNEANIAAARGHLAQHKFYSTPERFFRRNRDVVLNMEEYKAIMNQMFVMLFGDEERFLRFHFMSVEDLRTMRDAGMIVGSHGHNHLFFDIEDASACRTDLAKSFAFLDTHLGSASRSVTYPNGRYAPHLEAPLADLGVEIAFTTEPIPSRADLYRYRVPRLDTTVLPTDPAAPMVAV